ncbi:MAG: transcriptional regulator [Alphaproteobacteria bacterium]|nr:transcriptional regulator [Alphaproteobacteria bacterium]
MGVPFLAVENLWLKSAKNPPPAWKPKGLAGHLRHRRATLGLTRKAAATLIGVRGAAVTQWESGAHQPENECWPAIIRFLGFDPVCPDPITIPQQIAYVCRHRGMSRADLAGMLGVDKATVLKWERGGRPRSRLPELDRLVEELRIDEKLSP